MSFSRCLFALLLLAFLQVSAQRSKPAPAPYFPAPGNWEERSPESMGLRPAAIEQAVQAAISGETKAPRNMEVNHYRTFGKEPFGEAIGPFAERGPPTGLIIYKGYVVASWGEPDRCDMTHSVTKSFLSSVVGLAVDSGIIHSVFDTVARYVPPVELYNQPVNRPADLIGQPQLLYPFASPHNRLLTWDDMLRQVSDWEGTLWGKPEWADRPDPDPSTWQDRPRHVPGEVWEYNDVRVNALALAATTVWRKPLPQVLKQYIMDPIGASSTWRWTGYRNAWIVLDGVPVQSVSGGGHWGGGMFINAWDMARFGMLTLHRGKWQGRQLLSENWVKQALTPTMAKNDYGYMNWFLNTGKKLLPSAPETAFMHIGNGSNLIYVDPEHDLVVVARWIETKAMDEVLKKLFGAL